MSSLTETPHQIKAFRFGVDVIPEWFNELTKGKGTGAGSPKRMRQQLTIYQQQGRHISANKGDWVLSVNGTHLDVVPDTYFSKLYTITPQRRVVIK